MKYMNCTVSRQVSYFLLVSLATRQEARIDMKKWRQRVREAKSYRQMFLLKEETEREREKE